MLSAHNETKKNKCGLCGESKKLIKTECCDNFICDDADEYVMFSYAKNSCYRNHDRFTLCSSHYHGQHAGKWHECAKCKEAFDTEMYVYYGTNEFNFQQLANPPKFEPTRCGTCSRIIKQGYDGYTMSSGGKFTCQKCLVQQNAALPDAVKQILTGGSILYNDQRNLFLQIMETSSLLIVLCAPRKEVLKGIEEDSVLQAEVLRCIKNLLADRNVDSSDCTINYQYGLARAVQKHDTQLKQLCCRSLSHYLGACLQEPKETAFADLESIAIAFKNYTILLMGAYQIRDMAAGDVRLTQVREPIKKVLHKACEQVTIICEALEKMCQNVNKDKGVLYAWMMQTFTNYFEDLVREVGRWKVEAAMSAVQKCLTVCPLPPKRELSALEDEIIEEMMKNQKNIDA